MPHFKINPLTEMEYLSRRMKRFIDEFPESFSVEFGSGFEPRADILQDAEKVYVQIELPGVRKEDVKLVMKEDTLQISGVKHRRQETGQAQEVKTECGYGDFSRTIKLPCEVDADSAAAGFADGVISICLNKAKKENEKEFTINIQ